MDSLLFRAKGREEAEHRQVLMKSVGATISLEPGSITGKLNFKSRVLFIHEVKEQRWLASVSGELSCGHRWAAPSLQGRNRALGSGARHMGLEPPNSLSVAMTLGGLLATPKFQLCRLPNVNNDI